MRRIPVPAMLGAKASGFGADCRRFGTLVIHLRMGGTLTTFSASPQRFGTKTGLTMA